MTASRTWRSRSFRDAAMLSKLLPANNLHGSGHPGQVTDEGVEPQPALGRAHQALLPGLGPTPFHPAGGSGRQLAAQGGKRQPRIGAQREIPALQFPLLLGQEFLGLDDRVSGSEGAAIGLPRAHVPATHPASNECAEGTSPWYGRTDQ